MLCLSIGTYFNCYIAIILAYFQPSMEEGKFLNKQDELAPEEFSENKDVLSNVVVPTQNSSEGKTNQYNCNCLNT